MIVLLYASILLLATNCAYGQRGPRLQCRDENDSPVDWYVLYKLPKIPQSSNPMLQKGLGYLYITNKTADVGWRLSNKPISANNSIPAFTLAPIYDDETSAGKLWVLHSDSPPDATLSGKYGHTKGAVVSDKKQGFWLVHSVPNFPPTPNGGEKVRKRLGEEGEGGGKRFTEGRYDYPESGLNYGQSFLCVSLGSDQMDIVGKQLMYNQIIVYSRNVPLDLAQKYPVLSDAVKQVRIRSPPYYSKVVLKSLQSVEFTSFAKSDKWQKDLYDDFVAPSLQSDLMVSTWLNGRRPLPSDCVGAKVYNIESVTFPAAKADFKTSRDHSKWAVAVDNKSNRNWVCIGDINRAETQYTRGGGTVCFNNPNVWKNYRDAVNDVQPCQVKRVRRFETVMNPHVIQIDP